MRDLRIARVDADTQDNLAADRSENNISLQEELRTASEFGATATLAKKGGSIRFLQLLQGQGRRD